LGEGRGGLLSVVGAVNWDISIFEERFARAGEEVPVRHVEEFSGGKGANVAVAAARVLGAGRVAFIGALGEDDIAGKQISELGREGVLTDGVSRLKGCRSGRAYIVVDSSGKKAIHTHFGANERLTPELLSSEGPSRIISMTSIMIVMDPPTDSALEAARMARRGGATVLYSPGVRTQEGYLSLRPVIEMSDYIVLDSIELRNMMGTSDEERAVEMLVGKHPHLTVVATLGERGCRIARGGAVSTVAGVELPALGMSAVNTTGCGDAFLGVFSSYILLGKTPLESAAWANLAGAIKATRYETRGSPTRDELEKTMERLEQIRRARLGLRERRAS
jgi:ribokinase